MTHEEVVELAKDFFLKFEEMHINKFDEMINIVTNERKRIKVLMTSTRTKKENYMIIWEQSGHFYIGKEKNGMKDEVGLIFEGTQYKYKGEFKEGKKEGKGIMR